MRLIFILGLFSVLIFRSESQKSLNIDTVDEKRNLSKKSAIRKKFERRIIQTLQIFVYLSNY